METEYSGETPAEDVDDYDVHAAPAPPPPDLRDWASPEQLLEMGRLMDQMRHQHKVDVDELRTELRRVIIERDGLAKELARHERAAETTRALRMDAERARASAAEWSEERAALVLRLQTLTNEVMKLRSGVPSAASGTPSLHSHDAAHRAGGMDPRHRGHDAPSSPSVTFGAPTPSTTTTASFLLAPYTAAVEELRAELVAALEAQFREGCCRAEAERRIEFLEALHGMQLRSLEHRVAKTSAALSAAELRAGRAMDAFNSERSARDQLEAQYTEAMRAAHNAELELQAVRHESTGNASRREEHLNRTMRELDDQLARAEAKAQVDIHSLAQQFARQRDEHLAAIESVTQSKAAAVDHLTAANESLQEELSCARRDSTALASRLHDDATRARQEVLMVTAEFDRVTASYRELSQNNATAVGRVDELQAALSAARVDHERLAGEYWRLRTRYDEAMGQVSLGERMQAECEALRVKLARAEEDVTLLHAAHERFMREAATGAELLQRQVLDEQRKLVDHVRDLERRAAEAEVRAKRAMAERDLMREKLDAQTMLSNQTARPAEAVPHAAPPSKPMDIIALLQGNLLKAAALNRSINGGHAPPQSPRSAATGTLRFPH
jgi:hypothetical protein